MAIDDKMNSSLEKLQHPSDSGPVSPRFIVLPDYFFCPLYWKDRKYGEEKSSVV